MIHVATLTLTVLSLQSVLSLRVSHEQPSHASTAEEEEDDFSLIQSGSTQAHVFKTSQSVSDARHHRTQAHGKASALADAEHKLDSKARTPVPSAQRELRGHPKTATGNDKLKEEPLRQPPAPKATEDHPSTLESKLHLIQRHAAQQPEDVMVTTSSESWFSQMGDSFIKMLVGIVLFYFAFPVLWLNEKRNARHESLLAKGEADCKSISADDLKDINTHVLVHVNGDTNSTTAVRDHQFNVGFESGVVRMTTEVEIYQWKEIEKKDTKTKNNAIGGGKKTTTRTWKEYKKEWLNTYHSGAGFEKKEGHQNTKPNGIEPGSFVKTSERVEFGKGFLFSKSEVQSLTGDKYEKVDKLACNGNKNLEFAEADERWYFCGKGTMKEPEIGALRVCFKILRDGPATAVALQGEGSDPARGCFLPYRAIRRPMCPLCTGWLSEEQEKERLYEEAHKSKEEINQEDMWQGQLSCLCCACNLIQMCMGVALLPELHSVYSGKLTKTEAFKRMKFEVSMVKWIIRLVGWIMMFAGLCFIFAPFTTLLRIVPLLGGFLESLGGAIVTVASGMVTIVIALLIVALAYSMYHPFIGLLYWGLLAAVIAGFIILGKSNEPASAFF